MSFTIRSYCVPLDLKLGKPHSPRALSQYYKRLSYHVVWMVTGNQTDLISLPEPLTNEYDYMLRYLLGLITVCTLGFQFWFKESDDYSCECEECEMAVVS